MFDREKAEILAVDSLGRQIGFGHLMSLATALWRRQLKKSGEHLMSGAFVPTVDLFVKDEHLPSVMGNVKLYDEYVSRKLEGGGK